MAGVARSPTQLPGIDASRDEARRSPWGATAATTHSNIELRTALGLDSTRVREVAAQVTVATG